METERERERERERGGEKKGEGERAGERARGRGQRWVGCSEHSVCCVCDEEELAQRAVAL